MERKEEKQSKITNDLMSRLNRIEGQVKGIKSMIERGEYCDDILTQISAVKSGMDSVAKVLLENHIRTCVVTKLRDDDADIVSEFIKTIGRLIK